MAITVGSALLSDEEFLAAFRRCELPLELFRHGDHLRFAWLVLHRHEFEESLQIVREGIRRFAGHHGAAHIYHETVTTGWVHLLASHSESTFEEFLAGNEHRISHDLLHRFWTPEVLDSAGAREHWVAPDRAPMPGRLH
jgi:hypothetical protein